MIFHLHLTISYQTYQKNKSNFYQEENYFQGKDITFILLCDEICPPEDFAIKKQMSLPWL